MIGLLLVFYQRYHSVERDTGLHPVSCASEWWSWFAWIHDYLCKYYEI